MKVLKEVKKHKMLFFGQHDPRFECSASKQRAFLDSLPEPVDDVERSYNQYQCQFFFNPVRTTLLNIASAPILWLLLWKFRHAQKPQKEAMADAIVFWNELPHNLIPTSLEQEFPKMLFTSTEKNYYLDAKALRLLGQMRKLYAGQFYFLLKCMLKISMYSAAIATYSPRAIIGYTEFSFTSSVLSLYCKIHKVVHINVMHGEKVFFIRDSFVRYDRYYVWEPFYRELLLKLHAEVSQFIVEKPPALNKVSIKPINERTFDVMYYLAAEKPEKLLAIRDLLQRMQKAGKRVGIRLHPRYTDKRFVEREFVGIPIETSKDASIEDSLQNTMYATAMFSTVLNQARCFGAIPILDDMTDPERFQMLAQMDYIMLAQGERLLSSTLKGGTAN